MRVRNLHVQEERATDTTPRRGAAFSEWVGRKIRRHIRACVALSFGLALVTIVAIQAGKAPSPWHEVAVAELWVAAVGGVLALLAPHLLRWHAAGMERLAADKEASNSDGPLGRHRTPRRRMDDGLNGMRRRAQEVRESWFEDRQSGRASVWFPIVIGLIGAVYLASMMPPRFRVVAAIVILLVGLVAWIGLEQLWRRWRTPRRRGNVRMPARRSS